jgi:hypothetical protein
MNISLFLTYLDGNSNENHEKMQLAFLTMTNIRHFWLALSTEFSLTN